MPTRLEHLHGVLLGTAVGDAIGLPREGLSARRAKRIFGGAPLRHRLVLGRGMISDDTEHACMTAQALIASQGDPARFARSLAWRLRGWFVALPAGVGMATAKAILRLWVGFPPSRSGVRSEGNGPAMRAPIIGAWLADARIDRLVEFVKASTRLTHRTAAAEEGALVVALAARHAAFAGGKTIDPHALAEELMPHLSHERLRAGVAKAVELAAADRGPDELLSLLNIRDAVTGWMLHTVPVALCCWLRHLRDPRAAIEEVVLLGGDTDTTAALVGALAGASLGADALPPEWVEGITEWPRSRSWIERLAVRLDESCINGSVKPLPLFWPAIVVRNVVFLLIVLVHGFRRLFPPY